MRKNDGRTSGIIILCLGTTTTILTMGDLNTSRAGRVYMHHRDLLSFGRFLSINELKTYVPMAKTRVAEFCRLKGK